MHSRPRTAAALAAVLVSFALVGGPVTTVPAGLSPALTGRAVTIAQAAPVAVLDPLPVATPGVPPARTAAVARLTTEAAARAQQAAASQRKAAPPRLPSRVVALTFDDGPDSRWTPQVLALLARYHAHATFCVIGRQVRTREALVRAVLAHGNTLCNHSFTHDERLGERSQAQMVRELRMTDTALHRAAPGAPVPWFRAPGGAWAPQFARPLALTGHRALDWTVDPRDWDQPGVAPIVHRVMAGLRPGAVVDLHDGGGDRSQTVAALRLLLPMLAFRGYTCVAVTPAMAAHSL